MDDSDTPRARGGSAAVTPAAPAGGGRAGLDRTRILRAAVEVIDTEGLRSLTMRRLGQHLGVEAMALYHHVPGREALLDGIVELVMDELYGDPDVHLDADSWQDYLQRLAHGVRRIALAHPQLFPLIATRPPAAPWIRPPLRSLRWIDSFLGTLIKHGFSDRTAVDAYRMFSSFLLGHLLLEVSALGVDTGPVDEPAIDEPVQTETDLSDYPNVARLERGLTVNTFDDEFEESLETLVDRLDDLR